MNNNTVSLKGFTLIELLIVIGIIAVLATAVLLILNPAQILAEARDTQRLSDFDTVKNAINTAAYNGALTFTPGPFCTFGETSGFGAVTDPAEACTTRNIRAVDGSGWVAVDFGASPPIAVLPIDPTNNATYFYAYKGDDTNKTFELNTRLESAKHRTRMTEDGGNRNTCGVNWDDNPGCYYETGIDPNLDL